jgi:hypothetical protein
MDGAEMDEIVRQIGRRREASSTRVVVRSSTTLANGGGPLFAAPSWRTQFKERRAVASPAISARRYLSRRSFRSLLYVIRL